jgi:hypothetical protein
MLPQTLTGLQVAFSLVLQLAIADELLQKH